jgi:hypothetical protein
LSKSSGEGALKVFGRFFDRLRTLAGVRQVRQVPPARERPSVGSSIVRDQWRLRVKYAMDDEFWGWLASKGWRPMPLQNNRRRYKVVPEKVFIKLASADLAEREGIDGRLAKLSVVESDQSATTP